MLNSSTSSSPKTWNKSLKSLKGRFDGIYSFLLLWSRISWTHSMKLECEGQGTKSMLSHLGPLRRLENHCPSTAGRTKETWRTFWQVSIPDLRWEKRTWCALGRRGSIQTTVSNKLKSLVLVVWAWTGLESSFILQQHLLPSKTVAFSIDVRAFFIRTIIKKNTLWSHFKGWHSRGDRFWTGPPAALTCRDTFGHVSRKKH